MAAKFTITLPIKSRSASYAFYRSALGLETVGAPTEDGMPEPLQFALDVNTSLMLVPSDGLQWVIGTDRLAPTGVSECLLSLELTNDAEVRDVFEQCINSGASQISEPRQRPWGFEGIFADPDGHLWMLASARG